MIIGKTESEVYISYLGEAAVLVLLGFELMRLDSGNKPGQRIFVFSTTMPFNLRLDYRDIDEVVQFFNKDRIDVPARKFFNTVHDLKAQLYDSQRARSGQV